MKKILFTLIAVFSVGILSANADNDKIINKNQLPAQAQQFINKHFAGIEISYAKEEWDNFKHSYEVRLTDGTNIEFTSKGNWDEVNCRFSEVPSAIIPQPIREYIKKNYPGAKVILIEKDRNDYEVKLSNRLELKFDKDFNIYDIDD
jgi:predicted nucleotide-binding protein (sugar kinase/HSP70/actin superfamily)